MKRGTRLLWREGLLPAAMVRSGGALLFIDEINAIRRSAASRWHSVLDTERSLTLVEHEGERIVATPKFAVICAENPKSEFVQANLDRLHDRFVHVDVPYSRPLETRLVPDRRLCETIWRIREESEQEGSEIETAVSTRLLLRYARNTARFGASVAGELLVGEFRYGERETVRRMLAGGSPVQVPRFEVGR